jgi:hypothetical protein
VKEYIGAGLFMGKKSIFLPPGCNMCTGNGRCVVLRHPRAQPKMTQVCHLSGKVKIM